MMFGRKAPDWSQPRLWLSHYLDFSSLPSPPSAWTYTDQIQTWPMMLNDQLGICVGSMMGHLTEVYSTYGEGHTVTPTDQDVLKVYERVGGYVPGNANTDHGMMIQGALDDWTKNPLAGEKIGAWAAVNPQDTKTLMTGGWLFGGITCGVWLPSNAPSYFSAGRPWTDTSQPPNHYMGHAVPIVAVNSQGPVCVTWAKLQQMSWPWFLKYCDETEVLLTPDWLAGSATPTGIDFNAWASDWTALTGQPFPLPIPQPPTPPTPPVPPIPPTAVSIVLTAADLTPAALARVQAVLGKGGQFTVTV